MRDRFQCLPPGASLSLDGRYSPLERFVVAYNLLHVACLVLTATAAVALHNAARPAGLAAGDVRGGSSCRSTLRIRPVRHATTRAVARLLAAVGGPQPLA